MKVAEYSGYDALGLAELVAKKQVSPKELAQTAVAARDKVDGVVRAVGHYRGGCVADLGAHSHVSRRKMLWSCCCLGDQAAVLYQRWALVQLLQRRVYVGDGLTCYHEVISRNFTCKVGYRVIERQVIWRAVYINTQSCKLGMSLLRHIWLTKADDYA